MPDSHRFKGPEGPVWTGDTSQWIINMILKHIFIYKCEKLHGVALILFLFIRPSDLLPQRPRQSAVWWRCGQKPVISFSSCLVESPCWDLFIYSLYKQTEVKVILCVCESSHSHWMNQMHCLSVIATNANFQHLSTGGFSEWKTPNLKPNQNTK